MPPTKETPLAGKLLLLFAAVALIGGVGAILLWDENKTPPLILTVDYYLDSYGDPSFPLAPEDKYLLWTDTKYRQHGRPNELRDIFRYEKFETTSEKIPDPTRRFSRLLYIGNRFLDLGLFREAIAVDRLLQPSLQPWETLTKIQAYGFDTYTDEQKKTSEYYHHYLLQRRIVKSRVERRDSVGATVTAREIVSVPDRDRVLLAIMVAQVYANGTSDPFEKWMPKAEKTLSFVSGNGREAGYAYLAPLYYRFDSSTPATTTPSTAATPFDKFGKLRTERKKPDKAMQYLYRIRHDAVIEANAARLSEIESAHEYLESRIHDPYAMVAFLVKDLWRFSLYGNTDETVQKLNRAKNLIVPLPLTPKKIDAMLGFAMLYERMSDVDISLQSEVEPLLRRIFDDVKYLPPDDPLKIATEIRIGGPIRKDHRGNPFRRYSQAFHDELLAAILKDAETKYGNHWKDKTDTKLSEPEDRITAEMRQCIAFLLKLDCLDVIPLFVAMETPPTVKKSIFRYFVDGMDGRSPTDAEINERILLDALKTTHNPEYRFEILDAVAHHCDTNWFVFARNRFPLNEYVRAAVELPAPKDRVAACWKILNGLRRRHGDAHIVYQYRTMPPIPSGTDAEALAATLFDTVRKTVETETARDPRTLFDYCSILLDRPATGADRDWLDTCFTRLLKRDTSGENEPNFHALRRLFNRYDEQYPKSAGIEQKRLRIDRLEQRLQTVSDVSYKLNAYRDLIRLCKSYGVTDRFERYAAELTRLADK